MLTKEIEAEINQLALQYGSPRRAAFELAGGPFEPLTMADRYGEVCMVIRRPNGRLITAIKTFYPAGAFRLLTGGIHHGEPIAAALQREIAEETGLAVAIRSFLAVIEYRLAHPTHSFTTFAFLIEELGGELAAQDEDEQIGAFRELAIEELPTLGDTLEGMPDQHGDRIGGSWRDWGRFRAIAHRVVYEQLHNFPASSPRKAKPK